MNASESKTCYVSELSRGDAFLLEGQRWSVVYKDGDYVTVQREDGLRRPLIWWKAVEPIR